MTEYQKSSFSCVNPAGPVERILGLRHPNEGIFFHGRNHPNERIFGSFSGSSSYGGITEAKKPFHKHHSSSTGQLIMTPAAGWPLRRRGSAGLS